MKVLLVKNARLVNWGVVFLESETRIGSDLYRSLNICKRSIEDKYREGKLKSTSTGEWKDLNAVSVKLIHSTNRVLHFGVVTLVNGKDPSWNTDQGASPYCECDRINLERKEKSEVADLQQRPHNVWARAVLVRPERWWTIPGKDEARGNSGGGPMRYWRANRSLYLGIGAKD